MGNKQKHGVKVMRRPPQRQRSVIISLEFVAAIIVVLLGAVSAVFGFGSAAFTGTFGVLQITTTSVGLVLVIAGLIFLYKMTSLIPPDFRGVYLIENRQPISVDSLTPEVIESLIAETISNNKPTESKDALNNEPESSGTIIELSETSEENNPTN